VLPEIDDFHIWQLSCVMQSQLTRYSATSPDFCVTASISTLCRLGVKATTLKAKAKDLAFKAKAKDLASKANDGVKANVNMVRCSVKTSKHRRLLQGW